jgi:hypothetical protein
VLLSGSPGSNPHVGLVGLNNLVMIGASGSTSTSSQLPPAATTAAVGVSAAGVGVAGTSAALSVAPGQAVTVLMPGHQLPLPASSSVAPATPTSASNNAAAGTAADDASQRDRNASEERLQIVFHS